MVMMVAEWWLYSCWKLCDCCDSTMITMITKMVATVVERGDTLVPELVSGINVFDENGGSGVDSDDNSNIKSGSNDVTKLL